MKAWYLDHSSFAVETQEDLLIFDYFNDSPASGSLANGVFRPQEFSDKRISVFSSHAHSDHFNRCIFSWSDLHGDIRYLLSSDIRGEGKNVQRITPGESVALRENISVRALRSTDQGVAFLVALPDQTIYHAGDLNWWHWNGETPAYNQKMASDYREQIDLLRGKRIDLAFLPADPRLEEHYARGLDYFMRNVGATRCVPMHLWSDYDVCERLQREPCTEPYRSSMAVYGARGDQVL